MTTLEIFMHKLILIDFSEAIQMQLSYERFRLFGKEDVVLLAQAKTSQWILIDHKTASIVGPFNCRIESPVIDHTPELSRKDGLGVILGVIFIIYCWVIVFFHYSF